MEVFEEQQRLEAKSDSLIQLMRAQYRDAGLQPDEVTATLLVCMSPEASLLSQFCNLLALVCSQG